ncbi:multidrug efflux SMR transporter [Enterococcus sp. DIV0242_7C1]|uniref:SugE protein n=1 Tax=Candidatus Enterococcus dunnyi TaxID=1834192 RepID=A0A200ITZ6_9ENTE|nr:MULTISPECIES: multidrug efflux SMR transporter [unclassified Enterococcus]MBO0471172.1 multidrug efflux SMR transporter [Enterococcus sp. DIV0242_7C1]MCA5014006.1 multidrug efflux SMR transporter [Enterococcus sp. S23]MCA5017220.1 multidrug efflux SMR transporter [Enterococcus sp. S22(2020)]OUZ28436.1 SugE protein [Enterococcus sp. 9D6_DIV0238]
MSWFFLVIAGIFEMLGVASINRFNQKKDSRSLLLLVLAFASSFIFLYLAMKQLPMGVSYAIWTGIGAAGGAILGMILYGESKDWRRILFIGVILSSVIGLKLIA